VFEFWSLDTSSNKSISDVLERLYLKFVVFSLPVRGNGYLLASRQNSHAAIRSGDVMG